MEIAVVSVLMLLGIILFLAEIFLLPGITLAAIGGVLFTGGGVWYAYAKLGATGGNLTLLFSAIVFAIGFFGLLRSKALNKIALETNIDSTVADKAIEQIVPGDRGITLSRLNPIGKVRINKITVEAKTLGDFVDEDMEIEVLKVFPTQVVVREVVSNESE